MLTSFLQSAFLSPFDKKPQDKRWPSESQPVACSEVSSCDLLPNDMAGKILDLQMQCQQQSSARDLLTELINLYTKAIQYYESINSPKYHLYKRRLQSYLSKPAIQNKLKGADGRLTIKRQMVERSKLNAILSSNHEANRIIERSQQRMDSTNKIVESEVVRQHRKLEARIERRKSLNTKEVGTEEKEKISLLEKKLSLNTDLYEQNGKNKKILI